MPRFLPGRQRQPLNPSRVLWSGAEGGGSVAPQLLLSTVASDNFNRANGSIAGSNNWLATSDGTMAVSSNEAIGSSGAFTGNYRTDAYSSNQYSQCTVGSVALASGALIAVTARNQDAANGYAAVYFLNSGTSLHQLSIYKRVAGTWTELTSTGSEYDPGTLAQGTLLTFVAEGSQLTFSAAGVDSVSITDTTFTGGTPGIAAFGTPTLDNWAGGNAATGSVGAAVASDNFNRANGGLSVGQANWGIMTGYPAVDIPIVTNQLNPTTGSHAADVRTDAFNADQWSAIQMGTTAMNSAGFVGVLSRVNAGLNSGYLGMNFQNGSYKIYRLDAGASTLLATAHTLGNDAAATPYMLVSQGSRHSFRVNGREVIAATDGTYASGQPGIMLFPISTADSWSGGNT